MQFIKNGPDIPETLLQAHEDGRVVFFCGAGISFPANLPGFGGLVGQLFEKLSEVPSPVQQAAIKAQQFDTAIGLLEAGIGRREIVRRAIAAILKPDLTAPDATSTHEALLTLAKTRSGHTRLITTNFDSLFQTVIARDHLEVAHFCAPLLPVPKNRWNGLVYLHGLLPDTPTSHQLDSLVVSSGDFGLAYLTERWAARFVSELFRNYTVCFVGYSLNDPVLRYMTDALAADRLLGESPPEMFAFGSAKRNKEQEVANEWRAKNVTPILYRENAGHTNLHKTLRSWAETYRNGHLGKERIVVDCALAGPLASTRQDDFVGRMLWAISDPSGAAAKRFADHEPAPTLDWLEHFDANRYMHTDLSRFGVSPSKTPDSSLAFSMVRRPCPYPLSPWMLLAHSGVPSSQWDDVMAHLARWLARHLDDPRLILWLAKNGGTLHDRFAWHIEQALQSIAELEGAENVDDIERFKSRSPNGIPRASLRILWRLMLSGRVGAPDRTFSLLSWSDRFRREGMTSSVRLELRQFLSPRVSLSKAFNLHGNTDPDRPPVRGEVVLATDHIKLQLDRVMKSPEWRLALPTAFDDFCILLRDALDLMRELGSADDRHDLGTWHMPSISPHRQNRGYKDLAFLIELVRDAWTALLDTDSAKAKRSVSAFISEPYPTFVRLGLYAATHDRAVDRGEWVEWLVKDEGWWLWSSQTQREVMRLLVIRAAQVPQQILERLEAAILAGPPRNMYSRWELDEEWMASSERMIWLRLAKLQQGMATMSENGLGRLRELSERHPTWKLAENQREEFFHWTTGTGEPDFEASRQIERAPRLRKPLEDWLKKEPSADVLHRDDWEELCRDDFPVAAAALLSLSREGIWPTERWREALHQWTDGKRLAQSWRRLAPTVAAMPLQSLWSISHAVTWWLERVSKQLATHEAVFFELCDIYLSQRDEEAVEAADPVFSAINHPIGHVTQALVNWWFATEPEDDEGLPRQLRERFTLLCDTSVPTYQHARLVLCSNAVALSRVEPSWTSDYVVPLFDWRASRVEARVAWQGFLGTARLYLPLLAALKSPMLETVKHYTDLGEYGTQYATLLTFMALDPAGVFSKAELLKVIRALPSDGLQEAARALVQALESASEQKELYWSSTVKPFLERYWPKSVPTMTGVVAEQFARLAIAAGTSFPEAVDFLRYWLMHVEHPFFITHLLGESSLCSEHPAASLTLLDSVVGPNAWLDKEFGDCLSAIRNALPGVEIDERYRRLDNQMNRR